MKSNLPVVPRPTHMIYPRGKPVSLNDRIHELLEMSEYFKETDKVLAWQLRQTANRILDWIAYEQSQRGALLLTASSIGFACDGETGGVSHRSRNGEREASARA